MTRGLIGRCKVAMADSNQRAVLVTGIELALYVSNRLKVYLDTFACLSPSPAKINLRKSLVSLYAHILEFLAHAIGVQQKKGLVRVWQALWDSGALMQFEDKCDKLCVRASEEARICDGRAGLEVQLRTLHEIHKVHASVMRLENKVDLSKLETAKDATYNSSTEGELSRCLPDTRLDLLEQIFDWAADYTGKRIFWLCGKAGTGKSTISRTVAQKLDDDGLLGASFFFKRGRADRSHAGLFFPTIARQLADLFPDVAQAIAAALDQDSLLCDRHPKHQFSNLLLKPLQNTNRDSFPSAGIVLVIDALDECDNGESIKTTLILLSRVEAITSVRLRIFVTSRPELPVELGFKNMPGDLYHDVRLEVAQEVSLIAVPEATGATSDYVSGPGSSTQRRDNSTLGFGEHVFHDSGFGSSTRYQYDGNSNAPETDAASIRSDWSRLDLEESLKDDLREDFVTRLASETETYFKSDATLGIMSNLLRDFAILLRREAKQGVHHETAKFIRNERIGLAKDYQEKARMQLRPRSEYNIQDMVDEWDAGGMQSSAYDDFDIPQHGNGLSDPADTPDEIFNLEWMKTEEHRNFLFASSQFAWLIDRIKLLATRSCVGQTYHSIRGSVARHLGQTDRTSVLTLALKDWDPLQFLEQQHPHGDRELSQVLVYCGSLEAAYACTVGEYLDYMWPDVGGAMLVCIQSACNNTQKPSNTANVAGADFSIEIQDNFTEISLSGHGQSILELAEACIWLATTCREHKGKTDPARCLPRLDEDSLEMSVEYEPVTSDKVFTKGSCWLAMLGNSVIASGYPIPMRADGGNQKGLEASIGVLVALSQANWATNFQGKFMLKGLRSALVPVGEDESSITWHFLDTKDSNRRMTYNEAYEIAINSNVTIGELSGSQLRRNFVGIWTSSAQIRTGSNFVESDLYELHQSRSESIEHMTLTPSTLSITGGKFLNVGGACTLMRKDSRLARVTPVDFEFRLSEVKEWKVLFYGQNDKRAWLVDGASALLHLSIAWLVDPDVSESREKLAAFEFGSLKCGRPDARSVLLANRSFSIHQRFEGQKVETVRSKEVSQGSQSPVFDSTYGTGSIPANVTSRIDSKSTTSDFTYADLVEYLYQVLEQMVDNLSTAAQLVPQMELKWPSLSPMLIGWEAKDIIRQRTNMGEQCARVWI
jgi:hypothetical protein